MSKIGIIMLPGANIHAVSYWVKRCGIEVSLVSDPKEISNLNCLILPGVGAFDTAMSYLDNQCFRQAIVAYARSGGLIVGICLGMQILFESSDEGSAAGLGLLEGRVRRIPCGEYRVPNIGWRHVSNIVDGSVYASSSFFFMHSYGMLVSEFLASNACSLLGTVDCNVPLVAAFRKENLIGFQYHPEKSYTAGEHLLSEIIHAI